MNSDTPPASIPPEVVRQLATDDRGPVTIVLSVIFTVLSLISVSLRFYTRAVLMRNFSVEDFFMGIAMVLSIVLGTTQIPPACFGAGKHIAFVDPARFTSFKIHAFIAIISYCASLTFTKLSILSQYRRIFTYKEMRSAIFIVFGIVAVHGIESVLTGVFSCVPVDAFWDAAKKPTARCLDKGGRRLYYANAGIGIATDIMVAILPVKAVWILQIPPRQKIALLFLLTLGFVVCIVSMIRLDALHTMATHPEDPTWHSAPAGWWSCIEANLAIVCGSAPALKPLFTRFIPQFASHLTTARAASKPTGQPPKDRKSFIELVTGNRRGVDTDGSGCSRPFRRR
ncbi:hypothetical protein DM02DRAFT_716378 [Periconia macrospinosa]|uniref:Rhodopsin domain-containing protein n=1 Tax=Periconia macrospinosa TaxID=97972 RepID=A0A2V1E1R5_9PLEO|nr:hypothetical protein DM02DRAFT_716378 [Periconia macrospinosa]